MFGNRKKAPRRSFNTNSNTNHNNNIASNTTSSDDVESAAQKSEIISDVSDTEIETDGFYTGRDLSSYGDAATRASGDVLNRSRRANSSIDMSRSMRSRLDSEGSVPGAWAIPGPELRRQSNISSVNPRVREAPPQEILIQARIVEEEEDDDNDPSQVITATPLAKPGTWKWILLVGMLVLALTFVVAIVFIQASYNGRRGKGGDTDAEAGKVNAPVSSPMLSPVPSMAPSPVLLLNESPSTTTPTSTTEEPSGIGIMISTPRPSRFPTLSPTIAPTMQTSWSPTVVASQDPTTSPSTSPTVAPTAIASETPTLEPTAHVVDWESLVPEVMGGMSDDNLGQSVALSQNGEVLAIGARGYDDGTDGQDIGLVRVYQVFGDSTLQQIGQDLLGPVPGDQAGIAVDLSSNGDTVAIGSWLGGDNLEGVVQVYEYEWSPDGGVWNPKGDVIYGGTERAFFGSAVSLSGDGLTVVVGADLDGTMAESAGRVQMFRWNGILMTWLPIGQTFYGLGAYDQMGFDVAINGDGTLVGVGEPGRNRLRQENMGLVTLYRQPLVFGSPWLEVGRPLNGGDDERGFGYSMDVSVDGSTVVVSSLSKVHLFRYSGIDWVETTAGPAFEVDFYSERSQILVNLSPDGSMVVVSHSSDDHDPGVVRVYLLIEQDGLEWWTQIGTPISDANSVRAPSVFLSTNGRLAVGFSNYSKDSLSKSGKAQLFGLH